MEKREGERVPENGDRLRNNDFLTALDFDALSDEQLTDLLQQIIDNELNKPEEEADLSLVDACDALLGDLEREKTGEAEKIAVPETPEEAEQREKRACKGSTRKQGCLKAPKSGQGKGERKRKRKKERERQRQRSAEKEQSRGAKSCFGLRSPLLRYFFSSARPLRLSPASADSASHQSGLICISARF